MPVTVEFLYQNEKGIRSIGTLGKEVLGDGNQPSPLNMKIHQTIGLTSGNERKGFRIIKIDRHAHRNDSHMIVTVSDIPEDNRQAEKGD